MKKHLLIWIAAFALQLINTSTYGQGFIGETEQQIRNDFKDNPSADFHVNYMDKDRVLTAVDNSVQMRYMFNSKGVCCWSLMYIYDPKVLDTVIAGLDRRTTVIRKGEAWRSIHKGYVVKVEIGYSTSYKANYVMFHSDELKFEKSAKLKRTAQDKQDITKQNLGEVLGRMPTKPIPNSNNSAILTPLRGTESYPAFNPATHTPKTTRP